MGKGDELFPESLMIRNGFLASRRIRLYSGALDRDQEEIRARWQPLFRQYGVDLVLNAHEHTYARGYNIDAEDGIVYIVSVSGPKMYDLTDDRWMIRSAENTQLYHIIHSHFHSALNLNLIGFPLPGQAALCQELLLIFCPKIKKSCADLPVFYCFSATTSIS